MRDRITDRLKALVATPSLSRKEEGSAELISTWLRSDGFKPFRYRNNVWVVGKNYYRNRPTLLLNSHHDTVAPSKGWTREPYRPELVDDKLYGLGSNDAGGSVVALIEVFRIIEGITLGCNVVMALTAEEEVGGENGIRAFLPMLKEAGYYPDMAIVGEPTMMQPAYAERGLVVLDCVARGVSGHAARGEGVNAIYEAVADIERLRSLVFAKRSDVLGDIGVNVTQINAGYQHNVVPDECRFVVDVRTTDAYSNEETVEIIKGLIDSEVKERSTRVRASVLSVQHPLMIAARYVAGQPFVSPTTSDMSLMHDMSSLKIGPGDSSRSHHADEFIRVSEVVEGVEIYVELIKKLNELISNG